MIAVCNGRVHHLRLLVASRLHEIADVHLAVRAYTMDLFLRDTP